MVVRENAGKLVVSHLRTFVRGCLDNPFGDRLKSILHPNPPWYIRPWTADLALSDLIPWRCDDEWNTRFDIMNLPSLVFPDEQPTDHTLFVVFDSEGNEIKRIKNTLEPYQSISIHFDEILDGKSSGGTFACFHHAPAIDESLLNGSYFIDRQYVSFKRQGEPLWSFAHGNVTALTHRPGADNFGCLTTKPKNWATYRPQIHFDDCEKFEVVYANPTLRTASVGLTFMDNNLNKIGSAQETIPPAGVRVIEYLNSNRDCVRIEHSGSIEFWRPIIFKYYSTHFDVLHS